MFFIQYPNAAIHREKVICAGTFETKESDPKDCMVTRKGDSGGALVCQSTKSNRFN